MIFKCRRDFLSTYDFKLLEVACVTSSRIKRQMVTLLRIDQGILKNGRPEGVAIDISSQTTRNPKAGVRARVTQPVRKMLSDAYLMGPSHEIVSEAKSRYDVCSGWKKGDHADTRRHAVKVLVRPHMRRSEQEVRSWARGAVSERASYQSVLS